MEKESIIVKVPEKLKDVKYYIVKEMQDDIDVFSIEDRAIIDKWINGENPLTDGEGIRFSRAQERWWHDKYGFPFANKIAREEVIRRKYDPERAKEAHSLQWDLFQAVRGSDQEKVEQIKKRYQDEYPDQMEAIEAIFGIRDYLKLEQRVELDRKSKILTYEEKGDIFRSLTEYQFLFNHFLIQNRDDRKFLELFWSVAEGIAREMDAQRGINMLRRAQLSQMAVYRIIQDLGHNPKLSHPAEDAFEAIDLWEDADKPIQIKGWEEEVPAVFKTDQISFPAIDGEERMSKRLYNSAEYLGRKNNVFRAKVKNYGDRIGRDLEGYMLVIPYSKIDFVNGEPAPELVEFFKEQLKKTPETNN